MTAADLVEGLLLGTRSGGTAQVANLVRHADGSVDFDLIDHDHRAVTALTVPATGTLTSYAPTLPPSPPRRKPGDEVASFASAKPPCQRHRPHRGVRTKHPSLHRCTTPHHPTTQFRNIAVISIAATISAIRARHRRRTGRDHHLGQREHQGRLAAPEGLQPDRQGRPQGRPGSAGSGRCTRHARHTRPHRRAGSAGRARHRWPARRVLRHRLLQRR